ncbi:MAG: response regulator transcription factor [Sterolibacteriaceae bacterium MAG5]|nr:response regulator transcription factor [Candidatus Nitricoxidireducens bremensis]
MTPRGIKVLLVEDDAASRANTRLLLELEGFATLVAADGVEGLALILAEAPDVVVCDIMMPGLDGMGLLARVRETPACAATPFIFLTGLVDQRSLRAGMNGGADDYLTKPFAPEDLFAAIVVRHRRLAVRPDDREERRQQRARVRELLSQRELEVFDLIGSGVSSRDAAERLGISLRTVDSHRARILAKLDLDGAAALVSLAARIGAGSLD